MSLQVRPPDDVVLHLSDGEFIVVKKYLNAGEEQEVMARMVKTMKPGDPDPDGKVKPEIDYDLTQMGGLSKAVAYLIDWSAKDAAGKPIDIRGSSPRKIESALKKLPPDGFREIIKAIEDHENKMDSERVAQKNDQGGETKSEAISPSAE